MQAHKCQETIHLNLEKNKAIVLLGLIASFNNDGALRLKHPAEKKVLWDLECILHGMLSDVSGQAFENKVQQAREITWPTNHSRITHNLAVPSIK